jgi:hypothetical protein
MKQEPAASSLDPEQYCRDIESYLCRKNDGHLIRIVGPAFEQVCGWARRGVPLGVAHRGIDRYFERYYAKGPRRRPVRVEFCEADVLDAFDEWRRALGISAELPDAGEGSPREGEQREAGHDAGRKHGSLPAHLERVIARLTSLRAGESRDLDQVLDEMVRELDGARGGAKGLRGQAREAFLQRLAELDRQLLDAARPRFDEAALAALRRDADEELLLFRDRMPRDAYEKSHQACVDRLMRERLRLPVIAYDA